MIKRFVAVGAIIIAAGFGGLQVRPSAAVFSMPEPAAPSVDDVEVVRSFGDDLTELHGALAYEESNRDVARVERACQNVVAAYPQLAEAVEDRGTDLLVAAESMVDACRQGSAATLDLSAFEIVDGDYYTYRELSFDFAN